MHRFWLLGLTIITFTLSGFAQTTNQSLNGSLTGKVVEKSTNAPMEFANVVLFKASDSSQVCGGMTDEKGVFKFDKLSGGIYYMKVSFIGFDTLSTRAFALKNETVDLGTLVISVSPIALGNMEVSTEKPIFNNSIDRKVYNVEKDILSQSSSASDLLQNIPSVSVDVDGNVSLRGTTNVAIFLNGKPSLLMRKNSATVLEQMPANTIEKVEVITNPSAKYSPEGIGGIINIVLKKQTQDKLNGTIGLNASTLDRYNTNLTMNYSQDALNLFGSYGLRRTYIHRTGTDWRIEKDSSNQNYYYDNPSSMSGKPIAHMANLGMDHTLNDKNQIELAGNYFFRDFHRTVNSSSTLLNSMQQPSTVYTTLQNNSEIENEYELTSSYEHNFDKEDHTFKLDMNYSGYGEDEENHYNDMYTLPSISNSLYNNFVTNKGHLAELNAEYSNPISERTKLEAGYSGEFRRDDIRNNWENFDAQQGNWVTDNSRTNYFRFDQDIHAVYTTLGHSFGKFSFLAGIRAEQAYITSDLVTSDSTIPDDYFQVYPTLHLSYGIDGEQELQLNYSHRINRAESEEHNPFPEYHNPTSLEAGNPKIKPEQIHSVELGYSLKKEQFSLIPTIYYRYKYDSFTETYQMINDSTILTTITNLANDQSAGMEFVLSFNLKKLLSLNVSSDIFYDVIDASNLGYSNRKSTVSWNAKLAAGIHPFASHLIQVNGYYRPAELTPQGKSSPMYYLNLGLRQDLWGDKASVTLTVTDVFNSLKWENRIDTPSLYQDTTRKRNSRILFLGFIYRFGRSINKEKNEFKFEDEGR